MDYENPQTISQVGGANINPTNELKIDMHHKLWESSPSIMPLLAISSKMATDPAHNYRVDAQEENRIPTRFVVGVSCAADATTLVVTANGTAIITGTVLFNPGTNDWATVDSKPTTNSVTITKSALGSTGAVWPTGTVLWALLPRIPENQQDVYEPVSADDTNVFNYIQLIRMQSAITRTQNRLTTQHGGPGTKRTRRQQQKWYQVRETIELSLIAGARSSSGTAPTSYRTFGGLNYFLRSGTLFTNFNGILTESGFNGALQAYHEENPDVTNPMLFTTANVMERVNDFGTEKMRLSPLSETYGMDINTYVRRGLRMPMIEMPLLHDPETRGWGFLLDMDRVLMKTLESLELHLDAKGVGQSENIYDMYRGSLSFLLGNENRHMMFVGALN